MGKLGFIFLGLLAAGGCAPRGASTPQIADVVAPVGAPAGPAEKSPVAEAEQARQEADTPVYRLFFDWQSDEITRDGEAVVVEAAAAIKAAPGASAIVAGHDDRSASASEGLSMSQRRADKVAAALVNVGVPASQLTVWSYGDERPLIGTEDGVREIQNRRVEIRIAPATDGGLGD